MEYPLGPFPPEVLRNIVFQSHDPNLYRNLRLTSPRVNRVIEPVFPEQCRSPISSEELISFVSSYSDNRSIYLRPRSPRKEFISIEQHENIVLLDQFENSVGYRNRQVSFERFATLVPSFLKEFPLIDLYTVYQILQRRTLCVQFDPHYALRITWEMAKNRHRHFLDYLNKHQGWLRQTSEGLTSLKETLYGLEEVLGLLDDVVKRDTTLYHQLRNRGNPLGQIDLQIAQEQMEILNQEVERRLQQ